MSAIPGHDVALCRPLLERAPVVRAGDLLLDDRGCIDGATFSHLKRKRRVDGIIAAQSHYVSDAGGDPTG